VEQTKPEAFLVLDDQKVTLLSECLWQLMETLIAHGISRKDVRSLEEVAALSLLAKLREGETDPRKLTSYASMKVWGNYWRTDRQRQI